MSEWCRRGLWIGVLGCALGVTAWAQSPAPGGQSDGRPAVSQKKLEMPDPVQPGATQGGRVTTPFDAVPKFNMDYFVGEWNFEGDLADSPLGDGGRMAGTETVRNVWDGRFWDVTIKGEGPDGHPFTGKGVFMYEDNFAGQFFTRYEVTRGIATLKTGSLSCDMGGTCGLHYETPPFEYNGSILRLRGRYYLSGAFSYRLLTEISVNKGEYTNLGSIWYRKDERAKPDPIK